MKMMKPLKYCKTNAGLGYLEEAYFIQIEKNNFLCISSPNKEMYPEGEIIKFSQKQQSEYLEVVEKKKIEEIINEKPIWPFCKQILKKI